MKHACHRYALTWLNLIMEYTHSANAELLMACLRSMSTNTKAAAAATPAEHNNSTSVHLNSQRNSSDSNFGGCGLRSLILRGCRKNARQFNLRRS